MCIAVLQTVSVSTRGVRLAAAPAPVVGGWGDVSAGFLVGAVAATMEPISSAGDAFPVAVTASVAKIWLLSGVFSVPRADSGAISMAAAVTSSNPDSAILSLQVPV
ncbi:hypothetical protein AI2BBH_06900 [Alistipes indistinctus]|nr:hypothetical protein AI2BBH_06900 [Alistipes indistinctus]